MLHQSAGEQRQVSCTVGKRIRTERLFQRRGSNFVWFGGASRVPVFVARHSIDNLAKQVITLTATRFYCQNGLMARSRKFRFGIRTLLVCMTISAGAIAYYSIVWHKLGRQWEALERLEQIVGNAQTLPSKQEKESWILDWPVHFAFGHQRVGKLQATRHFDIDGEFNDECFELMLQVPNLESVSFTEKNVTVAMFDALTKHGIAVGHWGLKDFTLSDNFLFVSTFHKLDPAKLKFHGILWTKRAPIEYYVEGPTVDHKYASQNLLGSFETCEFGKGLDWKELEGRQFKPEFTDGDNHGNFYDGLHSRLDKHEIDVVSREKNVFRLRWRFNSEFGGDAKAEFVVPFTEVCIVKRSGIKTVAEAKEIVSRQFDLSDFEEPVVIEDGWLSFRFVLKSELRKQDF